jgi:RNA polymerase sigma factor (sigma-70 family)
VAKELDRASCLYLSTLFDQGALAGLSDGQLLERYATARREAAELAFGTLVERHGPMVLRTCRGILRDDHEAMDAFQATFLVLVRKGRSLWVRSSLGPWLHRVACRAAAKARLEAARRRAIERVFAENQRRTHTTIETDDQTAALHEEVNRLPERYRLPIVLCELEGYSCREAARHLGCPVGTVASRLARGRERLRGRLVRRGLAPAAATAVAALSTSSFAAGTPQSLTESTLRLAFWSAAREPGAEAAAASMKQTACASVRLANQVTRSLLMKKLVPFGIVAAAVSACVIGGLAIRPTGAAVAQEPRKAARESKQKTAPPKVEDLFPFMNDKERNKDFVFAEIGNMRPLINDEWGVRFQTREAILYKDGTAKLWRFDQKDPIVPPLRHKGPIRELTFLGSCPSNGPNVLVTTSDDSVKLWDALSGAPLAELPDQVMRPLWLSFAGGRLVTIDSKSKIVTVWDAFTRKAVATIRPSAPDELFDAALSGDGKTVVKIRYGAAAAAELWDVASGRNFATLRPPSAAVTRIYSEGNTALVKSEIAGRDTAFWKVVQSLAPESAEPAR